MLSYNETKVLIEVVLNTPIDITRAILHAELKNINSREGEFYESIAKHATSMSLTSEQWFDLLSKLPNQIFWSQISMDKVLSEDQIKRLPPATG